jgi:hypothetical protein
VVAVSGTDDLGVAAASGVRAGGAPVSLAVHSGRTLRGRLSRRDGTAVARRMLFLLGEDRLPLAWTLTGADGEFRLTGVPPAGGRLVARGRDPDGVGFDDTDLGRVTAADQELELTID